MTHPLSEAGTSVEVKPLEWQGDFAHTDFGLLYHVDHATGVPGFVVLEKIAGSSTTKSWWETIDAAKREAQFDYEQRILSALIQPTPAETEGDWQRGEQEMFVKWLPKLIATLATKPAHVDDVARLARLHELLASPTPPPRDGEGDLVALIEDLRAGAMFWETGGVEKEQTLEWKAAAALAAANRQISSYAVEERSLRAERDQWKRVATEDVEALQAIGEEFGILGGENRVSGCRRILTEQRAAIESLSRQLEEAREALKPFAELAKRLDDTGIGWTDDYKPVDKLPLGDYRRARSILGRP